LCFLQPLLTFSGSQSIAGLLCWAETKQLDLLHCGQGLKDSKGVPTRIFSTLESNFNPGRHVFFGASEINMTFVVDSLSQAKLHNNFTTSSFPKIESVAFSFMLQFPIFAASYSFAQFVPFSIHLLHIERVTDEISSHDNASGVFIPSGSPGGV
jgi:hypothetical protein